MRFPFDPETRLPTGRFLIQEPDYRTPILPLFDFATGQPDERVAGQGTVFRIDPWGKCATAFHVFESAFYLGGANGREIFLRQDRSIVALELEGIVFGTAPIQPHQWRTIKGPHSIVRIEEGPLDTPRMRNFTEVLAVSIQPSVPKDNDTIAAQRSGAFVSAVTLDPASGKFVRLEL
jgi:serine protease Do